MKTAGVHEVSYIQGVLNDEISLSLLSGLFAQISTLVIHLRKL